MEDYYVNEEIHDLAHEILMCKWDLLSFRLLMDTPLTSASPSLSASTNHLQKKFY